MDEYLLRNCDTGRIQPAGEEAILEKVLERGRGRRRGTRPGSSPSPSLFVDSTYLLHQPPVPGMSASAFLKDGASDLEH